MCTGASSRLRASRDFSARWLPADEARIALEELDKLRQGPKETVNHYASTFADLAGRFTLEDDVDGESMLASTVAIGPRIWLTSSAVAFSGKADAAIASAPLPSFKELVEWLLDMMKSPNIASAGVVGRVSSCCDVCVEETTCVCCATTREAVATGRKGDACCVV